MQDAQEFPNIGPFLVPRMGRWPIGTEPLGKSFGVVICLSRSHGIVIWWNGGAIPRDAAM